MPVQKKLTARILTATLALAALTIAAPVTASANANDTFTAIIEGETVLDMVFNNGDNCEFIINDKTGNQEAFDHMRQKITKLSEEKPVIRGTTHAWTLNNATRVAGQSQIVSVLITQAKDGTHRLQMDRRKGERRNNARRTRSRVSTPSVVAPAPPPRRRPPPADKD